MTDPRALARAAKAFMAELHRQDARMPLFEGMRGDDQKSLMNAMQKAVEAMADQPVASSNLLRHTNG